MKTIDTTTIDTTTDNTADDTAEGLAAIIRALPDDISVEEWAKARGLVARDEGVVPRGAAWNVHDEAGINATDIGVDRDPDEDDYDGDWLDIEESVLLHARWSLVVVGYDGDIDTVWVSTRTVVHPTEPSCDEASHDWAVLSARGDGSGVKTVDVCETCGCRRITNTGADGGDGDRFTRISYELQARRALAARPSRPAIDTSVAARGDTARAARHAAAQGASWTSFLRTTYPWPLQ